MSIESVLAIPFYAYGDNQAACEAFAELRKAAKEIRQLARERDSALTLLGRTLKAQAAAEQDSIYVVLVNGKPTHLFCNEQDAADYCSGFGYHEQASHSYRRFTPAFRED